MSDVTTREELDIKDMESWILESMIKDSQVSIDKHKEDLQKYRELIEHNMKKKVREAIDKVLSPPFWSRMTQSVAAEKERNGVGRVRENGYYWVNHGGDWVVAEWVKGINAFFFPGNENYFEDIHMVEIDEKRITRKISEEEWDDIAMWISDLKNIEERQLLLDPEDCKELAELLEKLARR